MAWTKLTSEKYAGKTLPQVAWSDPDWFFAAYSQGAFVGPIAQEAAIVHTRARNIRIPDGIVEDPVAQYIVQLRKGWFSHVEIARRQDLNPKYAHLDVLDLSAARWFAPTDQTAGKTLVKQLKPILFQDPRVRMTKKRCEDFFEDRSNFT